MTRHDPLVSRPFCGPEDEGSPRSEFLRIAVPRTCEPWSPQYVDPLLLENAPAELLLDSLRGGIRRARTLVPPGMRPTITDFIRAISCPPSPSKVSGHVANALDGRGAASGSHHILSWPPIPGLHISLFSFQPSIPNCIFT